MKTKNEKNLTEENHYRSLILNEFERRKDHNSSYSLRAFSRDLGVSSSVLSRVMSGERKASEKFIEITGKKIGLDLNSIDQFKTLKKYQKIDLSEKLNSNYLQLDFEVFQTLQDYKSDAILELMKIKNFQSNREWIASKINCSVSEVNSKLEKLQNSGLLLIEKTKDGERWSDLSNGFSTAVVSDNFTSVAHKNYQSNILKLAEKSLYQTDIKKRDNSSMMMATSPEKIKFAKTMIKEFRKKLCEFLEDTEDKSEVYQLSISLFPLLEEQGKGELK